MCNHTVGTFKHKCNLQIRNRIKIQNFEYLREQQDIVLKCLKHIQRLRPTHKCNIDLHFGWLVGWLFDCLLRPIDSEVI